MRMETQITLNCPFPITDYPQVLLAHGGGGTLMHRLIQQMFLPAFDNPLLAAGHDGAQFTLDCTCLAFTTDAYVVQPLFFRGGDIGTLAVNGTVNDLAMCGAQPLYLSASFILEEGLPMQTLWRIVQSMRAAAKRAQVTIVTGDTKVVERGKGDGIFISTAGVGAIPLGVQVAPWRMEPGDAILLNGDIGRHGIAIMAEREGLAFETTIESDCAPLVEPVQLLLNAGIDIHCMRDLTRGGLASALVELAENAKVSILIDERAIPVYNEVRGACELLGLDPLYVANEGRFICFVPAHAAQHALALLRTHPLGEGASIIGQVQGNDSTTVLLTSVIGVERIVDCLSGEQLPRIC
jgi:hydrogenase expression/formation protein HypE